MLRANLAEAARIVLALKVCRHCRWSGKLVEMSGVGPGGPARPALPLVCALKPFGCPPGRGMYNQCAISSSGSGHFSPPFYSCSGSSSRSTRSTSQLAAHSFSFSFSMRPTAVPPLPRESLESNPWRELGRGVSPEATGVREQSGLLFAEELS